ncbi:ferredoxin-type protein NapF [Shewanella sp. 202IG2-18]|uniref:ferredoxin-type protein NapF n=1 Tax=Parashewanella hymeniacidonis TaxID=2807618 RepID=UPI0019605C6F|nr:ferredoxin-type protein NapF [Parashewanella hymeniacidonis]MBM7071976.1 ferredoxin-type protein NapF [Parashewanella hymeniacidonis]
MASGFSQNRRSLFRRGLGQKRNDSAIRPPWVNPEINFVDECTRCDKCIPVCETSIISRGDGGFPEISFKNGECTFCQNCVTACPENIFDTTQEAPWDVKASIQNSCLAHSGVWCQSCNDYCDVEAISFEYRVNQAPLPQINLDLCTGCGACLEPCPNDSISFAKKNTQ